MGFDKATFAAKLRGKRNECDLTQVELASKAGVAADAIVKYESAACTPGADKVCAIAEVLGCTPNDLLGWI